MRDYLLVIIPALLFLVWIFATPYVVEFFQRRELRRRMNGGRKKTKKR